MDFCGMTEPAVEEVALQAKGAPAAKAWVDFAALTARLKPRPFKTKSKPEFLGKL
jgi:hypothetical protein